MDENAHIIVDESVGTAKDENMYNCPDCNKSYTVSNGQLKKHILIAHGRLSWVKFHCTKIPKIQEFYCKECTFYFRKEEKLAKHNCSTLKLHLRETQSKSASSNIIEGRRSSSRGLDKKDDDGPGAPLFNCKDCKHKTTATKIGPHIKKHHGQEAYVKFRVGAIKGLQEYPCETCGFYFRKVPILFNPMKK